MLESPFVDMNVLEIGVSEWFILCENVWLLLSLLCG